MPSICAFLRTIATRVSSSGHLDVGDEAPGEARDEALLHALELLRVLVARDDDLLVGRVERVERVEELFLRLLAPGEELDVVDEQQVAAARGSARGTRSSCGAGGP